MPEQLSEAEINDAARNLVGELPSNPWWDSNRTLNKLKEKFHLQLMEAYRLRSFDKAIDVLNYSDEPLGDSELAELRDVLAAIGSFTGGKAFDRIEGIAMLPRNCFGRESYGVELDPYDEIAGSVNRFDPVVTINIDAMRHPIRAPFKRPNQVIKYFHGKKPTELQFFVAHEIGHFMDLAYLSEINRHGFDENDPTEANKLQNAFGTADHQDYITKDFDAFDYPDPSVFVLEKSLTPRAALNPPEDFADTFAIAALGGDISSVPRKYQRLVETIHLARGSAVIGPHKVEVTKIV